MLKYEEKLKIKRLGEYQLDDDCINQQPQQDGKKYWREIDLYFVFTVYYLKVTIYCFGSTCLYYHELSLFVDL